MERKCCKNNEVLPAPGTRHLFVGEQPRSASIRASSRSELNTFQLALAAMCNLTGRHQWECKMKWVRMWNVPQPIRRLNLRLTANQVMALQVPERLLNSTQRTFSEEIMNFSLQEISASFFSIHKLLFFSVVEKNDSLVFVFCLMPKKCFLSHHPCSLSLSLPLSL